MTNPKMVCYCRYSCLDLSVALVDCQVEGRPSSLQNVCQGRVVILNYIDFEGGELNICRDCVDDLWGGGQIREIEEGESVTFPMYQYDTN